MEPTQENNTGEGVVPTTSTTTTPTPETVGVVAAPVKGKGLPIAIAIAVLLLGGAGYFAYTKYGVSDTVAIVNGKKIYQKELQESITLIQQAAVAQGIDPADETAKKEIQNQALSVLVNNALIITGAEKAGFTASAEDIQMKYDELVSQVGNAEELAKRMAEVGLTEEKLRQNIADRIVADKFIEAQTAVEEITVTDEEIATIYKTASETNPSLPPLEEAKPLIENEVRTQKQQAIVAEFIEKIRGESEVEIKIAQ